MQLSWSATWSPIFPITAELKKLASKDSKGIMWSFQLARKRQTVPPWSCPVEAWWLMSYPHRISNPRLAPQFTRGVGHANPELQEAPTFRWYMYTLCIGIRRRHRVPLLWNCSKSCTVPKPGKHANVNKCKRDRPIHVLDPLGKVSFAHLVRKKQSSSAPPWV